MEAVRASLGEGGETRDAGEAGDGASSQHDVTSLLRALRRGEPDVLDRLLALVYDELHAIAEACMVDQRPDHTLQATALLHEAFLRLARGSPGWESRRHFFGVAAKAMRQILVNHARDRRALKRGGSRSRVSLDESMAGSEPADVLNLLALEEALTRLATIDPLMARVVELRYFGGADVEQCARVLDVSTATVKRHWALARAWLQRELEKADAHDL